MSKLTIVLLVILVVLIIACIALYFLGKKAEKKQAEQQEQLDAVKQTVSMLVIKVVFVSKMQVSRRSYWRTRRSIFAVPKYRLLKQRLDRR